MICTFYKFAISRAVDQNCDFPAKHEEQGVGQKVGSQNVKGISDASKNLTENGTCRNTINLTYSKPEHILPNKTPGC